VAATLAAAAAATSVGVSQASSSFSVAYCSVVPVVQVPREGWGFHGGQVITGATGSYTKGHGTINLTSLKATGIMCQVDRVRHAPDRQIVMSIGSKAIFASHFATMFGVPGNILKLHVRVKSSTDPKCAVGTRGSATIFASYNGVHKDSVQYFFPKACKDHRHFYTGPNVVTNVPPN
jgi:hypothetical protein